MRHRATRRSILGLMGAGAVAAIGPVALGWRRLFAEAAGTPSQSAGPATNTAPTTITAPNSAIAASTDTPPPGSMAPPIEEIVFSGSVERVLGPDQFIGSGKWFTGITVDLSGTPASKIKPDRHQPGAGDTFISRGMWLGATGKSTWKVEFIDFNGYRIRAALSTSGITAPGANYTIIDPATGRRWQLVIKASNLTHFMIHTSSPAPTDALLAFPDGTGVDIIGWEDRPARPGVLVVVFLEAHP